MTVSGIPFIWCGVGSPLNQSFGPLDWKLRLLNSKFGDGAPSWRLHCCSKCESIDASSRRWCMILMCPAGVYYVPSMYPLMWFLMKRWTSEIWLPHRKATQETQINKQNKWFYSLFIPYFIMLTIWDRWWKRHYCSFQNVFTTVFCQWKINYHAMSVEI